MEQWIEEFNRLKQLNHEIVAGATRGAGRGIARALGEAGATVYCTGRSVRANRSPYNRPETIEETAEIISAAGGSAVALRVDHTVEKEVEALFQQVERERGRLNVLVNSIAGEDQAAWAATRKKDCYLSAQFRRVAARRGMKRAVMAVAHTMLIIAYTMLKTSRSYHELGGSYLDQINRDQLQRYFVKRLQRLGLTVTVEPTA